LKLRAANRSPKKAVFPLIEKLCDEDFEVLIETGGFVSTESVDERAKIILDVKCPASGEAERNHWANLENLRADKDEDKIRRCRPRMIGSLQKA
jgi:7-carboxy-7-deazaguanine synthase